MWSKTWKYVVYLRPALRIDCRGDHLWKTVDRSLPRLTGAFFRAWLRLRHGAFWGCAPAPLTKLDLIDWLIDPCCHLLCHQFWLATHNALKWTFFYSLISKLNPRQNGIHFADGIFKCVLLNKNVCISIKMLKSQYIDAYMHVLMS